MQPNKCVHDALQCFIARHLTTFWSDHFLCPLIHTKFLKYPPLQISVPSSCDVLWENIAHQTSNPIPFTISSFFALSPPLPCHLDGKIIEFRCFMHTLMPAEPFKSLSVCRTLTCPGPLALCDIRLRLDKCIQALRAPLRDSHIHNHTHSC